MNILESPFEGQGSIDMGLRELMFPDIDTKSLLQDITNSMADKVLYRVEDEFGCRFFSIKSPKKKVKEFIFIGPYITSDPTTEELLKRVEKYSLPPEIYDQIKIYYQDVPYVNDDNILLTMVVSFCELIWGGTDNFIMEDIPYETDIEGLKIRDGYDKDESEDVLLSIRLIEDRYEKESRLINAISSGKNHEAEVNLNYVNTTSFEVRVTDPIRNLKNYTVILNTLLRKGAEYGHVHPIYLDQMSSKFARMIEQITSEKEGHELQKKMTREYCNLVRTHSMEGYSPMIQRILSLINLDISADLSLKNLASQLNTNTSYLSREFKKETGINLSEYVLKKRIEYAKRLLKTTNMQINLVAQHVGIPDANYFSKCFKKETGMTPKEYRKKEKCKANEDLI